MGLLTEGSPLSWEDTKKLAKHVREHGIKQFINLYARLKDRQGDGKFKKIVNLVPDADLFYLFSSEVGR